MGGGGHPPTMGNGLRDAYLLVRNEEDELPDQDAARAKYDLDTEKEAAGLTKPGLFERFKRWFSARF